jgi:hypothetical protein
MSILSIERCDEALSLLPSSFAFTPDNVFFTLSRRFRKRAGAVNIIDRRFDDDDDTEDAVKSILVEVVIVRAFYIFSLSMLLYGAARVRGFSPYAGGTKRTREMGFPPPPCF